VLLVDAIGPDQLKLTVLRAGASVDLARR